MIQGCGHVLCFLDMVGRRRRWSERDGFAGQEISGTKILIRNSFQKGSSLLVFVDRDGRFLAVPGRFPLHLVFKVCWRAHPAKHCGGERKLPNSWVPAKTFQTVLTVLNFKLNRRTGCVPDPFDPCSPVPANHCLLMMIIFVWMMTTATMTTLLSLYPQ